MNVFSSLTNRIFFATALLAVFSMGAAIYIVNRAVTRQGEQELQRGIDEAATLVDEYRKVLFDNFSRDARLIADLPVLKAAVDTHDPATVEQVAREYQTQLANAELFAIADNRGRVLARLGTSDVPDDALAAAATVGRTTAVERDAFWPEPHGILLIKSVPIWIDRRQPDVLGTLILGATLDYRQASHFKRLTNSEIAFGVNGVIKTATLPESTWPALASVLATSGASRLSLGGEEYLAYTSPIGLAGPGAPPLGVVLRSQAERQQFLSQLHTQLGLTAVVAVLVAIVSSYAVARTVTRPVETITSTMREMAASGDLTRRIPVAPDRRWQDEDARLLAATFNSMTDSIEKFQREASQRERLSSLGRLSTVVAHEIRNPLMIIKTSLRTLRREAPEAEGARIAAKDIDEEITRLNRIVTEVLDFARPIKFELATADLNALATAAARAASAAEGAATITLELDPGLPPVTTDAERLRQALVNILGNAQQAVAGRQPDIRLRTTALDSRRLAMVITDNGSGISPEDMPRLFDPYFTTRRTGTGIGLAISRNIIEGLGGRITVSSVHERGTEVRIELPLDAPTA